jgi:hypothetical protein
MSAAAFLALLVIAMLPGAALRLELSFRRASKSGPRPEQPSPRPEPRVSRPELRSAPAGGYCQAPFSAAFQNG